MQISKKQENLTVDTTKTENNDTKSPKKSTGSV